VILKIFLGNSEIDAAAVLLRIRIKAPGFMKKPWCECLTNVAQMSRLREIRAGSDGARTSRGMSRAPQDVTFDPQYKSRSDRLENLLLRTSASIARVQLTHKKIAGQQCIFDH
jgi:hypothetical protein